MADDSARSVTAGLQREEDFATDVDKSVRTVKRWIAQGMPVTKIGATNWIDPARARRWFDDGMPPPPRACR
jgi:hypothetical protein